jgi:hypothetical protein
MPLKIEEGVASSEITIRLRMATRRAFGSGGHQLFQGTVHCKIQGVKLAKIETGYIYDTDLGRHRCSLFLRHS